MPTLSITPRTLALAVGESYQLTVLPSANGVKWCCAPFTVVGVTSAGRVTGLADGVATITARRGNTTAQVVVEVTGGTPTPPPPDPPTAQLQVFSGATEDDQWVLTTQGTAPAPGDLLASSTIDFGDGSPILPYVGAPPLSIPHTWPSAGAYTATLTVTAVLGGTQLTTLDLVVPPGPTPPDPPPPDIAPSAAIAFVSGQYVGNPFVFSTAGTIDVDGQIVSYRLDYGDGTIVTAAGAPPASPSHTYAAPGTYTVTLTVTDDDGLSGTATTTAGVQAAPSSPQAPVAKLAVISGYYAGDTFTFSTSGSADPDGSLVSGSFTSGAGQTQSWTGPPPALLTAPYSVVGTATATLTVTDNSGLSTQVSVAVVVHAAPAGQPHARFDALRALPTHFSSYALRSQAELNSLVKSGLATSYTYDAGEDAAKLTWPSDFDSIPIGQQLRLPIHQTSGTLLFTWDVKYSNQWKLIADGGLLNGYLTHKEYQITLAPGGLGDGSISLETRVTFGPCAADEVGTVNNRLYAPLVPGMTNNEPPSPGGQGAVTPKSIFYKHSVWCRFVEEVRLNQPASAFTSWQALTGQPLDPAGNYHMWSVWFLDPTRGPIRILYQVPALKSADGVAKFWLEHNTSSTGKLSAPAHLWSRDWVCLKNYPLPATPETDTLIFARPT